MHLTHNPWLLYAFCVQLTVEGWLLLGWPSNSWTMFFLIFIFFFSFLPQLEFGGPSGGVLQNIGDLLLVFSGRWFRIPLKITLTLQNAQISDGTVRVSRPEELCTFPDHKLLFHSVCVYKTVFFLFLSRCIDGQTREDSLVIHAGFCKFFLLPLQKDWDGVRRARKPSLVFHFQFWDPTFTLSSLSSLSCPLGGSRLLWFLGQLGENQGPFRAGLPSWCVWEILPIGSAF